MGSDVPFFLVGGTALVQGRGEIIDKIPTFTQNSILLVNPSIHISTKNAFLNLHKKGLLSVKNSSTADNVMKDYLKGAENFNKFKNSFEIGLFSDYTFINDVKTIMLEEGAVFSALTGSGSTMFGIFDNSKKLENAKNRFLHRSEYNIYMVKPLDKLPGTEKRVI
ncbi:MAG: hypothetical protein B6229_09140 [Spirochaetaceae bacterium 4572_7]|nr:MAG: hypothetical protein B6229_09140 [Spirochaetaceae bacterium 4572_7]